MYVCITRVHIYLIMVCTDGVSIDRCPCVLLAATSVVCHWLTVYCLSCVSVDIT